MTFIFLLVEWPNQYWAATMLNNYLGCNKGEFMVRVLCLVAVISVSTYAWGGEEASVLANKPSEAANTNKCCGCCKAYNVEESCNSTCRNRLFGGVVKKTTVRKVYRPVR